MSTEVLNPKEYVLSFEFPCNDETEASILYDVLRVDKEPKRSSVEKKLSVVNNVLHITLRTLNAKNLKPSFNSLLDYILLSKETIDQFGPPASKK
ncbi:hypothetical protein M8J77_013600 [Diaphorina citri]|nr:hypothetical protein M8J77_013600 [Diaphorina citri]